MSELKITKDIEQIKKRILSIPRFASIEQALIITESYKANEDKPRIIKRAIALKILWNS